MTDMLKISLSNAIWALAIKGYNLLIDLCYVHPSFHASDFVPSFIYPYLTDEAKSMLPPHVSDPKKADNG